MASTIIEHYIAEATKKLNESLTDLDSVRKWKLDLFQMIEKIGDLKVDTSPSIIDLSTTFDPTDWPSARVISHRILDLSLDYMQNIHQKPVWCPTPKQIRSEIENEPLPFEGQSLIEMYRDIERFVIPYAKGNAHPRYWGWVTSTGTLVGALADMISSTLNMNVCSGTHSATIIERRVIQWIRQVFKFPEETAGGIVTSGTSISTVICLAAARQRFLNDVRRHGLMMNSKLVTYASTEVHNCVQKALELLGLGSDSLVLIPVDENFSIKTDLLIEAIGKDRENGRIPFCVVGCAGTVRVGSYDDLHQLATIAKDENLWFHVDGAFGSMVILDPNRRHLVDGIEHADSLAFDFHKWLHIPYDAGCVLVRDVLDLKATFSNDLSYLGKPGRGSGGDLPVYNELGLELSRSFRALKIWCTIKHYGIRRLGEKIAENCEQIQYFAARLEKYPEIIRILRPIQLNVLNFRFEPTESKDLSVQAINELNNELLMDFQLSGIGMISSTVIHEQFYFRVCITNARSTTHDVDLVVDRLLQMFHQQLENTFNTQ